MKTKFQNSFIYLIVIIFLFFSSCKSKKLTVEADDVTGLVTNQNSIAKDEFEYLMLNGAKQKMLGNYEDAIAIYSKCLEMNPRSAVIMYELARIFVNYDDLEGALKLMEQAVKIQPANKWYQLLLADLYIRTKQLTKATDIYTDLVKMYNDNVDFKYELANLLINTGEIQHSLEILDELESENGVSEALSLTKCRLYLHINKKEEAIQELKNLITVFPDEYRYQGILAEYYIDFGEYENAYQIYTELLKKEPDNGILHLSLANYYKKTKDPENLFKQLKIVFKDSGTEVNVKIQTLLNNYSFFDANEKEKAGELIAILTEMYPENIEVRSVNAEFLIKNLKFNEAADELRYILNKEKSNYQLWEQLFAIELELGNYQTLFDESNEALEYFPNQSLIYFYNGFAAFNLQKYKDAIEILNIGKDLVINNKELKSQFYVFLGESYNRLERHNESDNAFDKALKVTPANKNVLNNYSYYLALRKEKLDKAISMIEKCLEIEPGNSTYLDTYAWVLYQNQDYQKALSVIEKALMNGGKNSAVIVEHHGDILYKLGKTKLALQQWREAKSIGTGSELLIEKIEKGILVE